MTLVAEVSPGQVDRLLQHNPLHDMGQKVTVPSPDQLGFVVSELS